MILQVPSGSTGKMSSLVSPTYKQSGLTCSFEFYYSVYGEVGQMYLVTKSGTMTREYWQTSVTGTSADWKYARVDLQTCLKDFTVGMTS